MANVIGKRRPVAIDDVKPGTAPTNNPNIVPKIIQLKDVGENTVPHPFKNRVIASISSIPRLFHKLNPLD